MIRGFVDINARRSKWWFAQDYEVVCEWYDPEPGSARIIAPSKHAAESLRDDALAEMKEGRHPDLALLLGRIEAW